TSSLPPLESMSARHSAMTTSPEIPDLARRALFGTAQFLVVLGVLIFAPAWSLSYWQGWLLWLHLGAWTLGLTLYFLRHDPALVARRQRAGAGAEQEPAQKRIQLFNTVAIL